MVRGGEPRRGFPSPPGINAKKIGSLSGSRRRCWIGRTSRRRSRRRNGRTRRLLEYFFRFDQDGYGGPRGYAEGSMSNGPQDRGDGAAVGREGNKGVEVVAEDVVEEFGEAGLLGGAGFAEVRAPEGIVFGEVVFEVDAWEALEDGGFGAAAVAGVDSDCFAKELWGYELDLRKVGGIGFKGEMGFLSGLPLLLGGQGYQRRAFLGLEKWFWRFLGIARADWCSKLVEQRFCAWRFHLPRPREPFPLV